MVATNKEIKIFDLNVNTLLHIHNGFNHFDREKQDALKIVIYDHQNCNSIYNACLGKRLKSHLKNQQLIMTTSITFIKFSILHFINISNALSNILMNHDFHKCEHISGSEQNQPPNQFFEFGEFTIQN